MAQQPPGSYPPSGPPPPPSAYPPPSGYQPVRARPGGVTTAAVLLIILGALTALGGIIVMIGGGAIAGAFGGLGGVVIVIGLLVLAYAVFEIIAGIKVLGLSSGWRIAGIVLAAIGAVFSVISLIGSFSAEDRIDPSTFEISSGPNIGSIIFNLIFLTLYVLVVALLARNGRAFTR
jgi:hypothetical protein